MRSTKVLLWSLMAFGLILASCTPAAVETEAPEEAPVVEEATEVMEEAEEVTEGGNARRSGPGRPGTRAIRSSIGRRKRMASPRLRVF